MKTESEKKIEQLGVGKILPLILRYSWPAVVTMLINQLYNVVDRIYIGHGLGASAIAGLALTYPIMAALAAIGVLIGMGSATLVSIYLGAGKMRDAERAVGQCVALKVLFGLIFPPLLYFLGFGPILSLLSSGTTAESLRLAQKYLSITIFFNVFAHLGFGLSATIRAEGSPKESMKCMMTGCLVNIILDPFFIFNEVTIPLLGISIPGFGWGVAGAAWATNIAMLVTCGSALSFYIRKKSVVRLRVSCIRIYRDFVGRVLAIGFSPFIMQMLGSLIIFSINYAFSQWTNSKEEGEIQIAAYSIFMTVGMLFFIPIHGIQQGLAPIIGFNWGAENYGRVRKSMVMGLRLSAGASIFSCAVLLLFARPIACCFADDMHVVDAAVRAFRIGNCMIWSIFVNVAGTTYFQAVGKPLIAALLSLLRQFVCLLPIVWILPYFMEDHIMAIWLALPISDIVTQIATIPPLMKEYRFLVQKQIGGRERAKRGASI